MRKILFILSFLFIFSSSVWAEKINIPNESFSTAKKILLEDVYYDYKKTIYCDAEFTPDKKVIFPQGFDASKMADRAERIEIEHVVAAENFARNIRQWKQGDPFCIDAKKKSYKGRKCAEKASRLYRLMQADLYNLYPAIGSVNAVRSNHTFTQLPKSVPALFGSCAFKLADDKVEVPDSVKGIVARAHLYFDSQYNPVFELTADERQQMQEWDKQHPVTAWECIRTYRIEKIQGNKNMIVKEACQKASLWPQKKRSTFFETN